MIEIKNLKIEFGKKTILNNINFHLENGDSLCILGANGCGKTTLLKAMLGLIKFKGEIKFFNKNIHKISRKNFAKIAAYVPQKSHFSFDYKVIDIVLMGALSRTSLFSNFSKFDKELAVYNLKRLGVFHLKDSAYTKISGGELQLVYIARALTQGASIVFLDEPTSALDYKNQIKFLEILEGLKDVSFIMTSHNPRHAKTLNSKILMLKESSIFKFGSLKESLNDENISRLYDIDYKKFKDRL